jgi:AcrR family transcriptional regulator
VTTSYPPVMTEAAARPRGRPPRISRDQIVEAGLAIAREHGITAVTMTSVAAALDVATPALYHYVSGRGELLALLGRHLS